MSVLPFHGPVAVESAVAVGIVVASIVGIPVPKPDPVGIVGFYICKIIQYLAVTPAKRSYLICSFLKVSI